MMNPVTDERRLPQSPDAAQERSRGVQDEETAGGSIAPLLITAATRGNVEAIARRIHQGSVRGRGPFVRIRVGALPSEARKLREACLTLLETAAGGSLLVTDVEQMPAVVQGMLIELLEELQTARPQSSAVRLMTGTTVSLLDRIAKGTFSETLFYRLNVIHIVAPR